MLSKCQLQITSHDKNLRIYSMIIKTTREEVKTPAKINFSQKNFQVKSFYQVNNGSSAKKKIELKNNSNLKQTTLFSSRVFLDAPNDKNLNKMMGNVEFIDDQRKIYENIKNNRQKTLRSYTSKERVPSHSYQNLFVETSNNNYVVCCKETPDVEAFIEEICKILGVCFLFELEEGVTHLIYEGFDQDIINLAKQLGVVVVYKKWLLDCINQRESLNPDLYKRVV